MSNLKDNKNSTSPFKKGLQNFFGSIANSYYREGKKDLISESTIHKERTALLDMLKSLFGKVGKVDDTLKDSVEKTIFNKASIPVKAFARLRVEDFFYATVINNLLRNAQDSNNIEEYGYTVQDVRIIEKNWRDLINKAQLIVRKQIKAKIDERLITNKEYNSFSSGISMISPGLKTLVKDFEEHILFRECLEFLEDKRKEFLDENPVNDKNGNLAIIKAGKQKLHSYIDEITNHANQTNIINKPLQVNTSNQNTDKFLKQLGIPEPTRSLLWITDEDISKIKDPMTFVIEIRTTPKEPEENKYNFYAEPSLIWTRLPIQPSDQHLQEPFYYPSYSKLSPAQRWEYLNWLKDITQKTNLSYVFLYYYGLERHLLFGDYDGAVEEIFRLIKYHNEGSFPHYAISALIAASAYKKRLDIVEKYPEIFYELTNESMYLRMLSGTDLTAEDILNLFNQKMIARNHYIIELAERYPDLFKKELTKTFNDYATSNGGLLKNLRSSKLEKRNTISFANISFSQEIRTFKTSEVLYNKELQASIRKIISDTYKKCKLLVK